MIVAAPFLCTVIFGPEFAGSVDDLRVLVFGAFGMVASSCSGAPSLLGVIPCSRAPQSPPASCHVVLDIVLIPPFGGVGAALASTLAYTAAGLVVVVAFVRALDVRAVELVPRPGDAGAVVRRVQSARASPGAEAEM